MALATNLDIVVEGRSDAHLIRALLGQDLAEKLRFFAAGGGLSRASLARNLLVHEGGPVLIVMDANTRNQRLVEERKSMAFLAASGVAPPNFPQVSDWVKVFAFVPEIEVLFFEAPSALEVLLGKKVPEEKIREGLLSPKATLEKMLDGSKVPYHSLATTLSRQAAAALASGRQAQALRMTIETMMTPAVKV